MLLDFDETNVWNSVAKITLNPRRLVPELDYDNNEVICRMTYNGTAAWANSCGVGVLVCMGCRSKRRVIAGVGRIFSREGPTVDFPGVKKKIFEGGGQKWRNFILTTPN